MASPAVDQAGVVASAEYRICQCVLDWLTSERMQLINISERINAVVRDTGTWQSIILAEFDGPRNRSVAVQVSGV